MAGLKERSYLLRQRIRLAELLQAKSVLIKRAYLTAKLRKAFHCLRNTKLILAKLTLAAISGTMD